MDQLMIMLAASIKKERIVDMLNESIQDYYANPCEDKMHDIIANCAILLTHIKADGSVQGAQKLIDELKKFKSREELFQIKEN